MFAPHRNKCGLTEQIFEIDFPFNWMLLFGSAHWEPEGLEAVFRLGPSLYLDSESFRLRSPRLA